MAERSHGREILPLIKDLTASDRFRADALAVSAGPGSFTGIRVGMSAARALAFAWDAAAIAVPTFEAWAEAASGGSGVVLALRPAGPNAVFAEAFRGNPVEPSGEPQRLTHDEVLGIFGKERLLVASAGPLPFPPPSVWQVRDGMGARAIGEWAVRHWEDGHGVGFHPIYLRPSQAEQGGRGAPRGRP